MNPRIPGKQIIFIFAMFTILLQIVFLFAAKNILIPTVTNATTVPAISLNVDGFDITQEPVFSGSVNLRATSNEPRTYLGFQIYDSSGVNILRNREQITATTTDHLNWVRNYDTLWNGNLSIGLADGKYQFRAIAYDVAGIESNITHINLLYSDFYTFYIRNNKYLEIEGYEIIKNPTVSDNIRFSSTIGSDYGYATIIISGTKSRTENLIRPVSPSTKWYSDYINTSLWQNGSYSVKIEYATCSDNPECPPVEYTPTEYFNIYNTPAAPTFNLSPTVNEVIGYPSKRLMKVTTISTPTGHVPMSITGKIKDSTGNVVGSTFNLTYQTAGDYWTSEYDVSGLNGNYNFCASGTYNATSIPWACATTAFTANTVITATFTITPSVENISDYPSKRLLKATTISVPAGHSLTSAMGKITDSSGTTIAGSPFSLTYEATANAWVKEYDTASLANGNYYFCAKGTYNTNEISWNCMTTTFSVSNTPPATYSISSYTTNSTGSFKNLQITVNPVGTVLYNVSGKIRKDNSSGIITIDGLSLAFGATSNTWIKEYDTSTLSNDTNYVFCATAWLDSAGTNKIPETCSSVFTVSNTPATPTFNLSPTVNEVIDYPSKRLLKATTISVPAGHSLASAMGKITDSSGTTIAGSPFNLTYEATANAWVKEYDTASLANGNYYFCAKGTYNTNEISWNCMTTTFSVSNTIIKPQITISVAGITSATTNTSPGTIEGKQIFNITSDYVLSGAEIYLYDMTAKTILSSATSSSSAINYSVSGDKSWTGTIDADKLTDNNLYDLYMTGSYGTQTSSSNHVYFKAVNIPFVAAPITITLDANVQDVIVSGSVINGTKDIKIVSNPTGYAFYNITGRIKKNTTTVINNLTLAKLYSGWTGNLDTAKLTNGDDYSFCASGYYDNKIYEGCSFSFSVKNTPIEIIPSFILNLWIEDAVSNQTMRGIKSFAVDVKPNPLGYNLSGMQMYLFNDDSKNTSDYRPLASYDSSLKTWSGKIDFGMLTKGDYAIHATGLYKKIDGTSDSFHSNIINVYVENDSAKTPIEIIPVMPVLCQEKGISNRDDCDSYLATPLDCRKQNILDLKECEEYKYRQVMPQECIAQNAKTQEECSKIIFLNSLPKECHEKNITNEQDCDKFMNTLSALTRECKNASISTANECDDYMFKNFPPETCKKENITTKEQCDYLIRNSINTASIAANSGNSETPSPECEDEGIKSGEECKKSIVLVNISDECKRSGITLQNECEELMFKKYPPSYCEEVGIGNLEVCKKYIFNSLDSSKQILDNMLKVECRQAGIESAGACKDIMKKIYMPNECVEKGIGEIEKCGIYLNNMRPKECRNENMPENGCDKKIFKKFAEPECEKAGITNEEECKNFMFNKYAPTVKCDKVNDWRCKSSIKEKHLGDIVATQTKFENIKEKESELINRSMSVLELKKEIPSAKDIIPIKEESVNLKVVNAQEKIVLDENEDLVQTSPIVLIIDTDGDGLPDDMEKRFGTDLSKIDTDGDGYGDSEEVRKGYNPNGQGMLTKETSPIDKAILENKTIEHPKTEGQLSENLAIDKITNTNKKNTEIAGYILEGKAEPNSIVTLYIYSDLPLVVTVSTDEFGNWKYELSRSLADGNHEAYVVVNDNTGKVVNKSKPLNFWIDSAKAMSVNDFVSSVKARTESEKTEKDMEQSVNTYNNIAIILIILGVISFVALLKKTKKIDNS